MSADIKHKLFIDDPELDKISLDFPNYVDTIAGLILHSYPKYTVGIFGGWGTGKTTLMKNIETKLSENDCYTVQFNAWRYSSDKNYATHSMMLEIITQLMENSEIESKVSGRLKRGTWRIIRGLKGSAEIDIGIARVGGTIEPELMEKIKSGEADKISNLKEWSKPILYEGMELISDILDKIEGPDVNPDLKLIVFIDDLDRCTPEVATEIFESIKIFFDIDGIVFVLGLSHEVIEAAINWKYKYFKEENTDKNLFSGKDYLKKIIQVPFTLPLWTYNDVVTYLNDLLDKYDDITYKPFFQSKINFIAELVEPNPREVKRLLNSFILSDLIHKKSEIDKDIFLAIHGLAHRWRDFYDMLPRGKAWLNRVVKKWDIITDAAQNAESEEPGTYGIILANEIKKEPILNEIEDLESIMYFIENNAMFLFTMTDQELEKYRRATIIEPKTDKVAFDPDIFDSSLFQTKIDMKKNRSKQTILNQVPSSIKPVNPAKIVQVGKSGGVIEGGQIQEKIADIVEVYPDSSGMIRFRYEPTRKHCSDHRLHLFLDDISIGTTDWFGYDGRDPQLLLQTEILTIDNVSNGLHKLKLQPEGREGGCNKGYVESWSGTLYLYQ